VVAFNGAPKLNATAGVPTLSLKPSNDIRLKPRNRHVGDELTICVSFAFNDTIYILQLFIIAMTDAF